MTTIYTSKYEYRIPEELQCMRFGGCSSESTSIEVDTIWKKFSGFNPGSLSVIARSERPVGPGPRPWPRPEPPPCCPCPCPSPRPKPWE
ncbi:MAG: hypothetical protein A3I05_00605 [Deltaproteobacteria bacterium RIFCSPLOWO2_02_FULL_44_10]|nr:MAG: hypothetical protein A3C46_09695 [Deltaproteobacteria bacterium RIFCSPHIGHO2_02_FULL_44_16]OGQ45192.1 MAG: hypothetical protein A3I05_00605 [Deltaproteobacteria bacterium RIFCSPLOWO2_02_FULL_44_10]